MEFFRLLFQLLTHLGEDDRWRAMVDYVGINKLYFVLFAIIFCETGLVVTPFLPGDSLIFAIGAVCAREIGLNIWTVAPLLLCAALLGDNANYWLGRKLGPAVFRREKSKLFNKEHLVHAQSFYETHGSKTVILARFVPIVRTFAPFVAGVGKMNYARFLTFSIIGGCAWVSICLAGGYFLGSRPFFKKHFELVVLVVIFVSLIPVAIEIVKAKRAAGRGKDALLEATTLGEKTQP